jgi:serine/threonine protein kinase
MLLEVNNLYHNRYRLLEKKGKGGFGEVWKAQDEQTGLLVALKVIAPMQGLSEAVRLSFINEFKETFNLSHSHLLTPNHYEKCNDSPYIVMPLCDQGSLERYVDEQKKITEQELARILYQISSGLEYLHHRGKLHNDIKPANILISDNNNYKLADFGISTTTRQTVYRNTIERAQANLQNNHAGMAVAYAAPELFGENPINTQKTDIFSLGVTLYELASSTLPWQGQGGVMLLKGAMIPNLSPNYSQRFAALVKSMLNNQPAERPNASDLKDAGAFYLHNGYWKGGASSSPPVSPSPPKPVSKPTYFSDIDSSAIKKVLGYGALGLLSLFLLVALSLWVLGYWSSDDKGTSVIANCTAAPGLLNTIKVREEGLILATENNSPPMFYCKDSKNLTDCKGFEYDLGRELARDMGLKNIAYAVGEYDELAPWVVGGKADIILSGYTVNREIEGLDWSDPYFTFGLCLITTTQSKVKNYKNLTNKKVLVYKGDETAHNWVEKNIPTAEIIEKSDPLDKNGTWLQDLVNNKFDAAIYDEPYARHEITQYHNRLEIRQRNLSKQEYAIALPCNNEDLKKIINNFLKKIKSNGEYEKMLQKYNLTNN